MFPKACVMPVSYLPKHLRRVVVAAFGVGHHRCGLAIVFRGNICGAAADWSVWQGPTICLVEYYIEGWTIYSF